MHSETNAAGRLPPKPPSAQMIAGNRRKSGATRAVCGPYFIAELTVGQPMLAASRLSSRRLEPPERRLRARLPAPQLNHSNSSATPANPALTGFCSM
jgi:hypothetical protein